MPHTWPRSSTPARLRPSLNSMRLLDPRTFQFTDQPNYLNHPPEFYDLLAWLGPKLEGRPRPCWRIRLIDIAIAAIGLGALLGLGLGAGFTRNEFYAYAVPLACIPVLAPLAGSVNNDNLAFFGGALATLGIWQLAASERGGWLALALAGVVAAAWAKATGLVLTGAMVSAAIVYLIWRRRWRWPWTIAVAVAFLVAAAPYIALRCTTAARHQTRRRRSRCSSTMRASLGLAALPRKSFPAYLGYFVVAFIAGWMPALGPRGVLNYAMLVIPVAALICAAAGIAAVAAAPVGAAGDGAGRRRRRGHIGARSDIRAACPPQLRRSPRDRLADGGLSALLPAARRDRAARRLVTGRGDPIAAMARWAARVPDCRADCFSPARRAAGLAHDQTGSRDRATRQRPWPLRVAAQPRSRRGQASTRAGTRTRSTRSAPAES